jgi:hypothetical protein
MMARREDPIETLRWEAAKEAPIDTDWLRMETIPPTWRQRRQARRERRAAEQRERRAWILGDIARLEYELGLTDEKPSGTVIVDGYSIPVPVLGMSL